MHGKQTSGLFDWESSIRVRLDMKMGHSGVPFVKKYFSRAIAGWVWGARNAPVHFCGSLSLVPLRSQSPKFSGIAVAM